MADIKSESLAGLRQNSQQVEAAAKALEVAEADLPDFPPELELTKAEARRFGRGADQSRRVSAEDVESFRASLGPRRARPGCGRMAIPADRARRIVELYDLHSAAVQRVLGLGRIAAAQAALGEALAIERAVFFRLARTRARNADEIVAKCALASIGLTRLQDVETIGTPLDALLNSAALDAASLASRKEKSND